MLALIFNQSGGAKDISALIEERLGYSAFLKRSQGLSSSLSFDSEVLFENIKINRRFNWIETEAQTTGASFSRLRKCSLSWDEIEDQRYALSVGRRINVLLSWNESTSFTFLKRFRNSPFYISETEVLSFSVQSYLIPSILTISTTYPVYQVIEFPSSLNLLENSSFEHKGVDLRPTGFDSYSYPSIPITFTSPTGWLSATGMGVLATASTTGTFGVAAAPWDTNGGVTSGWHTGTKYTISVLAKKINGRKWTGLYLVWNTYPLTTQILIEPTLSDIYQRFAWCIQFGVDLEPRGQLYISVIGETETGDELHLDDIQVELGAVVTPYQGRTASLLPGTIDIEEVTQTWQVSKKQSTKIQELTAPAAVQIIDVTPIIPPTSFEEYFDTGVLNKNKWVASFWTAPGGPPWVPSNYSHWDPSHVDLSQGCLALKLTQVQDTPGHFISTGGEVATIRKFGYGTYSFTVRAGSTSTTPHGVGVPVSGSVSGVFNYYTDSPTWQYSSTEIDFEALGDNPNFWFASSWAGSAPDPIRDPESTALAMTAPEGDFHVLKFVWTATYIDFYMDGVFKHRNTNVIPSDPAPFIFNFWGSNTVNWGGLATPGVTRWMYVKHLKFDPIL